MKPYGNDRRDNQPCGWTTRHLLGRGRRWRWTRDGAARKIRRRGRSRGRQAAHTEASSS